MLRRTLTRAGITAIDVATLGRGSEGLTHDLLARSAMRAALGALSQFLVLTHLQGIIEAAHMFGL